MKKKEYLLFKKGSKNSYSIVAQAAAARAPGKQKFFGSFFQKRTLFF
jgi:hypothetical protein